MSAAIVWVRVPGTPNYECATHVAIYKRTVRGFADYWTFAKSENRRTLRAAVAVGGLPTRLGAAVRAS